MIVFASDRGKANPGELYELTPGATLRDISRSPAADTDGVPSPTADLVAFWSNRSGPERLYLASDDGSHLRLVAGVTGASDGETGRDSVVFSADGTRLVTTSYPPTSSVARRYRQDPVPRSTRLSWCAGEAVPSPDGTLVACQKLFAGRADAIRVYGDAGTLRFAVTGSAAFWSGRGMLAVAGRDAYPQDARTGVSTVVDGHGRVLGRVTGYPVAWTPDGRRLLLDRTGALVTTPPGRFASGGTRARPASEGGIAISPDSRFVEAQTDAGSVVVPLAGGAQTVAVSNTVGVWSTTGRLAYLDVAAAQAMRDGTIAIDITPDRNGRNPKITARLPDDGYDGDRARLQWLSDGDHLLVSTESNCGGDDLYGAASSGGSTRPLTRGPRDVESPAFSPDGTRIAYTVEDSACGPGDPVHIETMSADGTGATRVTDDAGDGSGASFDGDPAWSLDGTQIVFSHDTIDGDTSQLQSAPASGGGGRTILATFTEGQAPSILPTGLRSAYVHGRKVMELPPGGGAPVVLAAAPPAGGVSCGYGGGIAWSADGKMLAVARAGGIYTLVLGSGAPWKLAIRVPCAGEPAFSPDGSQIAFDAPSGKLRLETDILAADVDGSRVHTVSAAPFRVSRHPTWSP